MSIQNAQDAIQLKKKIEKLNEVERIKKEKIKKQEANKKLKEMKESIERNLKEFYLQNALDEIENKIKSGYTKIELECWSSNIYYPGNPINFLLQNKEDKINAEVNLKLDILMEKLKEKGFNVKKEYKTWESQTLSDEYEKSSNLFLLISIE